MRNARGSLRAVDLAFWLQCLWQNVSCCFFITGCIFFMVGYSFLVTHCTLFTANYRFFDRLFYDRLQFLVGVLYI